MSRGAKRRAPSMGLIGTLIVLAIVLWLSARNWMAVSPRLATSETHRGGELEGQNIPGLDEMHSATGAHTDELRQALGQKDVMNGDDSDDDWGDADD